MIPPNGNWLRSMVMLRALVKFGAKYAVISPGSRNTPLAHSALLTEGLETIINTDERSAAFIALGIAKESGNPVILICTSGTAVANYFPAVVEAEMTNIPLILLTADRPERLIDSGAPQTINQENIFGKYVNRYLVLPEIGQDNNIDNLVKTVFESSRSLSGPVQINSPYDEPLQPVIQKEDLMGELWEKSNLLIDGFVHSHPSLQLTTSDSEFIKELIKSQGSIAIYCGPNSARNRDEQEAIGKLAKGIKAQIICDITSNVRQLDSAVTLPELLLRKTDDHLPEVAIWFGGYPTSKNTAKWLTRIKQVIRVQDHNQNIDPDKIVKRTINCSIQNFCDSFENVNTADNQFSKIFREVDLESQEYLNNQVENKKLSHELISVIRSIKSLPPNSNLVLANSMSIRYADYLCKPRRDIRVFGNKGANGIDGLISTSIGIAKSSGKQTLLITGDLAFLHDINSLSVAVHEEVPLAILLLNNSGGGIFHHLPAKDFLDKFDQDNRVDLKSFETIHGTPHSVDFRPICEGFGVEYYPANSDNNLEQTFNETRSPKVIEIKSSREETAKSLKEFFRKWQEQ